MTRALTLLTSFANMVNDRVNPVVVKELRQAVQSRLVIAILLLFLGANVLAVSMYLTLGNNDVVTNPQAGLNLFQGLYGLLVVTSMVFVPLYAAIRLSMERNNSNIDLLFITTIPPGAVIRGKFLAAVLLTVLIYAACMPFLTLTYLLRGIDLPSIFFALATSFLMSTVLTMVAIFVGSVSAGMFLRIMLAAILLYAGGTTVVMAIAAGVGIASSGLGFVLMGPYALIFLGFCLLSGAMVLMLAYLLAVAAVSPKSSNRMFPTRVFLTICWAVYGAVFAAWASAMGRNELILGWCIGSGTALIVIFGLVLAERESWSPRVRRTIPANPAGRLIAWLFYTGSAGGVIWVCLLAAATLLIAATTMESFSAVGYGSRGSYDFARDLLRGLSLAMLFTWCYGMSGLFLRRMFLPRTAPLVSTVLGLVVMGLGASLPMLASFFIYNDQIRFYELPLWFVITNPFIVVADLSYADQTPTITAFLMVWAILGLIANGRWFSQQWNGFRHLEAKPLPELAPVTGPESAVTHG